MVFGALLAAGVGAAASAIGGHAKKQAQEKNLHKIKQLYEEAKKKQSEWLDRAGEEYGGIAQLLMEGYGEALGEASKIGVSSKREASIRGRQLESSVLSDVRSSGFGNSSVFANARRSVAGDVGRSFADIDERLAGIRTGLLQARTGALAGAKAGLGTFYQQRAGAESDLPVSLAHLLSGVEYQGGGGEGIGSFIGGIAPYLGGMFGGGGESSSGWENASQGSSHSLR